MARHLAVLCGGHRATLPCSAPRPLAFHASRLALKALSARRTARCGSGSGGRRRWVQRRSAAPPLCCCVTQAPLRAHLSLALAGAHVQRGGHAGDGSLTPPCSRCSPGRCCHRVHPADTRLESGSKPQASSAASDRTDSLSAPRTIHLPLRGFDACPTSSGHPLDAGCTAGAMRAAAAMRQAQAVSWRGPGGWHGRCAASTGRVC